VDVKQGDVVSVAGKGRLTITEVTTTKKEKFAVKMSISK
jgi:RNA-binding protein YlmH